MRQFARPFPLERLSLEARVLYTAFLVFLGAGLASSVWLYASSFGGLRADSAASYYLGDDRAPGWRDAGASGGEGRPGAAAAAKGPALELPDADDGVPALDLPDADAGGPALDLPDADAGGQALPLGSAASGGAMRLGQSPRQVMETFHFHLFTVPVVLLIVGHLFMLTAMRTGRKVAIISVASVATFVHLFAPLAIRFGGASFGWLMPASVAAASLGWVPMIVLPLWEMWRRLPAKVEAPSTGAAPR
ncbi:MAG TPA: hypothetical protein VGD74_07160 [Vulgatibacter sp.]